MTYKIYKANGKKSVKNFENIEDAKSWIWAHEENGNTYYIEFKYEEEEDTPRKMYV